jgi:hypothetical protein
MSWGEWDSGGIAPLILNLSTWWSQVDSFTLLPLYSQGKSSEFPLNMKLGRPQSQSGHFGEEKKCLTCQESNHNFLVANSKDQSWYWLQCWLHYHLKCCTCSPHSIVSYHSNNEQHSFLYTAFFMIDVKCVYCEVRSWICKYDPDKFYSSCGFVSCTSLFLLHADVGMEQFIRKWSWVRNGVLLTYGRNVRGHKNMYSRKVQNVGVMHYCSCSRMEAGVI